MSDTNTAGDSAVTGAGGCCGDAPQTTRTSPAPASDRPCCGTAVQARAESSCCGSAAKSTAVAAGQGCCG